MLSKLEKTETLADKYQNLGRNLIDLVSESENPYAYSLLLDAHESIEILLYILSNKTNTRSIDEIALIHLNYQMLGAALEKLPRKFTLKFPHLSQAVFANTIDAKGACWIPRVICAHIVSFEELYLNYNNKLEEQFLSEIIVIKDAIEITIEKQLKPLLSVLRQPLKISINPSNEGHYSNPKTIETKIPNTLQYVDNCIGVLSEVERVASCNYSILSKSLARQSLVILAWQFLGENLKKLEQDGIEIPSCLKVYISRRNFSAHVTAFHKLGFNPSFLYYSSRTLNSLRQELYAFRTQCYSNITIEPIKSFPLETLNQSNLPQEVVSTIEKLHIITSTLENRKRLESLALESEFKQQELHNSYKVDVFYLFFFHLPIVKLFDQKIMESLAKTLIDLEGQILAKKTGKDENGYAIYTIGDKLNFISKLKFIEAPENIYVTVLEMFYHYHMLEHMEFFLQRGVDPNITMVFKKKAESSILFSIYSLLHDAIVSGNTKKAKLLLKYGAMPGVSINNAYLIYHILDQQGDIDLTLLDQLLESGIDVFRPFQANFKVGYERKDCTVKSNIIGHLLWKGVLLYDYHPNPTEVQMTFKSKPELLKNIDYDYGAGIGRIICHIFNQYGADAVYDFFKHFELTTKQLDNKKNNVAYSYDMGTCIKRLAFYGSKKTVCLLANLFEIFTKNEKDKYTLHQQVLFNNADAIRELFEGQSSHEIIRSMDSKPNFNGLTYGIPIIPLTPSLLASMLNLDSAKEFLKSQKTIQQSRASAQEQNTHVFNCLTYLYPGNLKISEINSIISDYLEEPTAEATFSSPSSIATVPTRGFSGKK